MSSVKLINDTSIVESIIIDGVELNEVVDTYDFDTPGEHSIKIVLKDSVTSIGEYAFQSCTGLTSITIPDSVTSIGYQAFRVCDVLTSVTIGNSVTSIGDAAFYYCSKLTSITCNATTAPTIQSSTFKNIKTNGTLTVPIGSTGYDVWVGTGNYYLGKYNWTKVEQ